MSRLNLETDEEFDQTLKELAIASGGGATKADVIRNAVATYKFLKQLAGPRAIVSITDDDGNIKQNINLP